MAIYDDKWFEFWYSDGENTIPHHFLIVTPALSGAAEILIIDPLKNNEIIFRGENYEEVCLWLGEDEYNLVQGREFPDDAW